MNLLCPNCQKPLSVPEQYAGQPMRCPLCAGTFTVPALPQAPAPPPPPAPKPPPPPEPRLAPSDPADVYGVRDGGAAATMAAPPPDHDLMELPADAVLGAPPPPRKPAGPASVYTEEQPTFPIAPVPEGYHRRWTLWASPLVLQYVAPVALFLVLVLTCFSWTGIYPGGVTRVSQNAWQATIGGYYFDNDIGDLPDNQKPGWNFLLILFLMLFLLTFVVTVACLVLAFLPSHAVPPAVHPVLPWRWGISAALTLVLLLFLVLQLVLGFSLEKTYLAAEEARVEAAAKAEHGDKPPTTPELRQEEIAKGMVRQQVSRTIWLDLVVLFLILAVVAAGLMFWLNRRGARPAPRADYLW